MSPWHHSLCICLARFCFCLSTVFMLRQALLGHVMAIVVPEFCLSAPWSSWAHTITFVGHGEGTGYCARCHQVPPKANEIALHNQVDTGFRVQEKMIPEEKSGYFFVWEKVMILNGKTTNASYFLFIPILLFCLQLLLSNTHPPPPKKISCLFFYFATQFCFMSLIMVIWAWEET